jgi:peptide deformylase
MTYKVITIPTSTLRDRSKEVTRDFVLLRETQDFIQNLIATMYEDDGIGIAAPQVGNNIRICIIGKNAIPGKKKDLVLINPIWIKTSRKTEWDVEGCLSVPKIFGKVKRYITIEVEALDETGTKIKFEAKKFFARVIQHEVDHLDGILFIDKAKDTYTVEKK